MRRDFGLNELDVAYFCFTIHLYAFYIFQQYGYVCIMKPCVLDRLIIQVAQASDNVEDNYAEHFRMEILRSQCA